MSTPQKDFFISYTGRDRVWAEWIAWGLEQAGYTVIIQAWDFPPGSNFVYEMDNALKQAERVVAVLSSTYLTSKYAFTEWAVTFRRDPQAKERLLLPVRVEECKVEGLLGPIVYCDLVGCDEQEARERLIAAARGKQPHPTSVPFPGTSHPVAYPPHFPVHEKRRQRGMPEIKALFLAANPRSTPRLAIDEEMRAIKQKLRASQLRDALVFESDWAVRPDDLLQLLNQHKPHIVHFSGHGKSSGLSLVGNDGEERLVTTRALQSLFTTLKDNVRLVLLNACYSREQAKALVQTIDCVIGMNDNIGDKAAIAFASSFYRAIGFGRSLQEAFDQGITSLLLEEIPEEDIPELLVKDGIDPKQIVLIEANQANP